MTQNEQYTAELIKGAIAAHLDISEDVLIDLEASGNLDEVVKAVLGTRALEASQAGDSQKMQITPETLADAMWLEARERLGVSPQDRPSGRTDFLKRVNDILRHVTTQAAQPQEAVAWMYTDGEGHDEWSRSRFPPAVVSLQGWTETPLYATPPQAAESGLLDEALEALSELIHLAEAGFEGDNYPAYVRARALLTKAGKPQP